MLRLTGPLSSAPPVRFGYFGLFLASLSGITRAGFQEARIDVQWPRFDNLRFLALRYYLAHDGKRLEHLIVGQAIKIILLDLQLTWAQHRNDAQVFMRPLCPDLRYDLWAMLSKVSGELT